MNKNSRIAIDKYKRCAIIRGMKLQDFLKSKRGLAAKIAGQIGCTPVLLSQWSASRPVPIERCVPIEVATKGDVMRWDLRPNDWWQIWPELVCHPNAPEVPTGYVSSISVDDGLVPSPQGPGSFSGEVKCG